MWKTECRRNSMPVSNGFYILRVIIFNFIICGLSSPPEEIDELSFRDYPAYTYPSMRNRLTPFKRLSHATMVLKDDQPAISEYNVLTNFDFNASYSDMIPRFRVRRPHVKRKTLIPKADTRYLRDTLQHHFSSVRDDSDNGSLKFKARDILLNKMKEYNLDIVLHNFTAVELSDADDVSIIEGVNVIGILHGRNWGKSQDGILLIGAHYDTVPNSPGVDDNGSGVSAMLEIARVLSLYNCKFKNTIIFVAFDMEEVGGLGSLYFVRDFLVPDILQKNKGHFQGAYILDSVLNFDNNINSQEIPQDIRKVLPSLSRHIAIGGYRGNFLAMMSRWTMDAHLSSQLLKSWEQLDQPQFKLFHMGINMGSRVPPMNILAKHLNFLRSDHVMFWYHNTSNGPSSLNAVLITDTALFRGRMRHCYHSLCDDLSFITPENLLFVKKLVDALVITLINISDGYCPEPSSEALSSRISQASQRKSINKYLIFLCLSFYFYKKL
ncbi:uncharacterized protein LOC111629485 isoform X1 [Centruroides sculpturatus]|uniref:uncharacterized protein LOC111629485 isoform X1 n=1 Tax=Centruroides sculpturatus TaxID=218467 RepID=UPI000C6D52EC|nr:uncharacterized protein LOC111629485 isoform X1 [Centruroides sculpturatus]XP_023229179.1 uncharacterized protein LOC111629485 isoform X1 [Centruroides sculpturatus]XP_023229185.1 uncharacterized protein LOC111629485 isoform X1 [Centruroides sculpturatus]XP_023229190.1 uncharacterized protein LOC111629485 isoform X1 [Centruroides sculpturatus]